jgi:hypothetical protein
MGQAEKAEKAEKAQMVGHGDGVYYYGYVLCVLCYAGESGHVRDSPLSGPTFWGTGA